jgi:hypothetical protein
MVERHEDHHHAAHDVECLHAAGRALDHTRRHRSTSIVPDILRSGSRRKRITRPATADRRCNRALAPRAASDRRWRRRAPIDVEADPAAYWTAAFELTALAGELSRPRGGRWIETTETPVPFAIRLASGELAKPAKLAQRIIAGQEVLESLAGAVSE